VNYSELTLRYFETAGGAKIDGGAGALTGADVHRGAAGSRARGTWVQFDVQVGSQGIRAARFLAFGCPHTIAVSAWVAEHAAAAGPGGALPESVQELSDRFEVPAEKRGRLLVIEDAWAAALAAALQR